jgi:DNA invertase Pin-like site-specific DNA recombinase
MSSRSSKLHADRRSQTRKAIRQGIGIYVRKSTERQGDLSLPAQERIIRAAITGLSDQPIYRIYKDVLSGTRPDRHEYQQMLADARAGRLTMVVFHKVNRFGRNAVEGLAAINELRDLGVEVRVADMPGLDISTPEGLFVFTFLLGQGQYEVENLGNEAIKGMQQAVINGRWPFPAPDGYVNRRIEITAHKFESWVEANRKRAAIVRLIFRWYATGTTSLQSIAERLHRLHETRVQRGKSGCLRPKGGHWTTQTLWHILTNRFYIGIVEVEKWNLSVRGQHRPIISQRLFQRVQQVLEAHGHGPIERHVYLLHQRVVMDGGAIRLRPTTVKSKNRRYYYRPGTGRRRYYDADRIDEAVVAAVFERLRTMPISETSVPQCIRKATTTLRNRTDRMLDEIQHQRKRLLRLASMNRFTEAEIAGELNRLEAEEKRANREYARADMLEAMHEPFIQECTTVLNTLQNWSERTADEQKHAMAALIDEVEINDKTVVTRITWSSLWDCMLGSFESLT